MVLQLVNFSIVPIHLQVPYCAAVSFVWTIILSCMRGADTGAVEETQAVEATVQVAEVRALEGSGYPPAADKQPAAASSCEGGKSGIAAAAPDATRAPAGAEKAPEGSVASGTGVPIGGILAVVRAANSPHAACTYLCMPSMHVMCGTYCSRLCVRPL